MDIDNANIFSKLSNSLVWDGQEMDKETWAFSKAERRRVHAALGRQAADLSGDLRSSPFRGRLHLDRPSLLPKCTHRTMIGI